MKLQVERVLDYLHGVLNIQLQIESLMNNKWYDLYDKLTLRRLIYQRDLIFSTKMEKFLMDNLGKQYKLTVSKLLRNESVVMVL